VPALDLRRGFAFVCRPVFVAISAAMEETTLATTRVRLAHPVAVSNPNDH
jgi:hypothetical protein